MSGQWEVVTNKKDKVLKANLQNNGKDLGGGSKKKTVASNAVKIEDVLPKSQVKNLYSSGIPKKIQTNEKKGPEAAKKPQKKQPEKNQEGATKPKLPKSIESALNSIDPVEFKSMFEKSLAQFPDAPIIWLKELAQCLNQKIPVEVQDPVFTKKPTGYPLSTVPIGIRSTIERAIKLAQNNTQLFFDISLTSMAVDMAKNLPGIGHKIFLQYIAINEPEVVESSMAKHVVLRNSYQNRPNIGLSILWAVGQAGLSNFEVGFRIFQELMLPLLEMKNYSKFVVKYLVDLIKSNEVILSKEQYLTISEIVFSNKKNFPSDLRADLMSVLPGLKSYLLSPKGTNFGTLVDFFSKQIANNSSNKAYQECLVDVLVDCFIRDATSLEGWAKNYSKNVASSAIVLTHIDKNWKKLVKSFKGHTLKSCLNDISVANSELLLKKRREDGLVESVDVVKRLTERMASETKKSGSSCGRVLLFLLSLALVGLVYYDIKQHGSWQESRTRRTLKDVGVCEFSNQVARYGNQGLSWVDKHIEGAAPGYKETVAEFSAPYIQLAKHLGVVACNIGTNIKEVALAKYPLVLKTIDSYAPGLVEQTQKTVISAWSSTVFYFDNSIDYLRKEVFVGHLSPENMQRVVIEAFNTTQVKATEYYHWLYEKVQTSIK